MKAAKISLQKNEAIWAKQCTQLKQPSCSLLEGVRESLYSRLSLSVRGTKCSFGETQQPVLPRLKHQQRGHHISINPHPDADTTNPLSPCKQAGREDWGEGQIQAHACSKDGRCLQGGCHNDNGMKQYWQKNNLGDKVGHP